MSDKLSLKKRLAFYSMMIIGLLALFEITARIALYVKEDFNPYYIKFGFVPDTEFHSRQEAGYTKFQPHVNMHQKFRGKTIEIQINADGFRDKRDFAERREKGELRIATLGASSTFGYYVEDHETYPSVLEALLQDSYPEYRVRVFNLGVPHARIKNIVELARHELPKIRPDVVTLYEGCNDANNPRDLEDSGYAYRIKDWLYYRSMFWRFIHPRVKSLYFSFVKATNKNPAQIPNLAVPILLPQEQIEALRSEVVANFTRGLNDLADISQQLDADLVLITQAYNLKMRSGSGLEDQWRTYEEEVAIIADLYSRNGRLKAVQSTLIIHNDVMELFRDFARRRRLGVVEGIEVITPDSAHMLSGVHLSPRGNAVVARAIHDHVVAMSLRPLPEDRQSFGLDPATPAELR